MTAPSELALIAQGPGQGPPGFTATWLDLEPQQHGWPVKPSFCSLATLQYPDRSPRSIIQHAFLPCTEPISRHVRQYDSGNIRGHLQRLQAFLLVSGLGAKGTEYSAQVEATNLSIMFRQWHSNNPVVSCFARFWLTAPAFESR